MNPFTPNFGQVPLHIAGRTQEISDVEYALNGNLGSPARTSIFVGARGSGKTALLTYLAGESHEIGWISANASCGQGIQEDILQQAIRNASHLLPETNEKHISGISIGNLFSLDWEREHGMKPNWRTQMTNLLDALEEQNVGLLITIDEVDPKIEEMIQIASVYQLLVRENRKIALLMAGLPSRISSLLNHNSVSFL